MLALRWLLCWQKRNRCRGYLETKFYVSLAFEIESQVDVDLGKETITKPWF